MIKNVVCHIIGHRIDRRKVRFDGLSFTCRCRRCGSQLEREASGWATVSRLA
jgi:hypothetical protein